MFMCIYIYIYIYNYMTYARTYLGYTLKVPGISTKSHDIATPQLKHKSPCLSQVHQNKEDGQATIVPLRGCSYNVNNGGPPFLS